MNVLFVHEVDWLSKVVFDIHNLAEALSSLGHRVYAIDYENPWRLTDLFSRDSLRTSEFARISRAMPGSSVTLRRPGFIHLPGLSRLSAAYTHYREIGRTIRDKHIDVVMLYSVPTNGLQTISQAHKVGVPVVFRSIDILHEMVPYRVLRPATKYLERRVYASADEILAITPNHARYVKSLGAPEERVKQLLYPIDTNIFHPGVETAELGKEWNIRPEEPLVLFIGTLFEFSGLDRFLARFPELLAQVPDARLLIVGDGPQRGRLEAIIKSLDLSSKVTITGFQPYQTMPGYIGLATVCINTFLDTEATHDIFPGKIIQYLACGKATVATPLLGITTLVPDESRGVVYAPTPEAMVGEVTRLLLSEKRRAAAGRAGVTYVKLFHDQQHIAKQLEKELLALTADGGGGTAGN